MKKNSSAVKKQSRIIVPNNYKPPISIAKYRKLTNDTVTSDEIIVQRLMCIERFCRGVAIVELQKYANKSA